MAATDPPSADPADRRRLQHALLLIVRQHGGEPGKAEAARQELARWRRASEANEHACMAALRAWHATEAGGLKDSIPLPPRERDRRAKTRRKMVTLLGVGGAALAAAGAGRWIWRQPVEQLALRTGRGQLLPQVMPDGSRLDLAARTYAEVAYYRDRRHVRLYEGEIRFAVARDPDRPFTVDTDWGRVRVLGTEFSVTVRDLRMAVAVAEGSVAVWAGTGATVQQAGPLVRLAAGQSVEAGPQGLGAVATVDPASVGAWRQGWLVFDAMPLPEAVARWNDYLAQPLVLDGDRALRALRLTGSFPLRDPDAFLSSLPGILPVRITRHPASVLISLGKPTP